MKVTMGPEMRYGKALFELASAGDKSISKDVQELRALFAEDGGLKAVLADEVVSKEDKKTLLVELLKKLKATDATVNFASLMCDKGRASLLEAALNSFTFFEKEANGVVTAAVRSAQKLTASQKKSVEKFVKDNAENAKTVELEEEIDASLIAGLRVRIGSVEHDMSVRGRLDTLRTSLN